MAAANKSARPVDHPVCLASNLRDFGICTGFGIGVGVREVMFGFVFVLWFLNLWNGYLVRGVVLEMRKHDGVFPVIG